MSVENVLKKYFSPLYLDSTLASPSKAQANCVKLTVLTDINASNSLAKQSIRALPQFKFNAKTLPALC